MSTWKKITLWLIGGIVLILVGGLTLLDHLAEDMCASTVIEQYPSPSGKRKAVVFQMDCGASTGFSSQVSIMSGDVDASQKGSIPKSFFVADGDHGRAPAGKGGGPELRIVWQDEMHLQIQHHSLARLFRADKESKGVGIDYATYR